jgi:hypothetical protein
MAAGQRVRQAVSLRLSGKPGTLPPGAPPPDSETVTIEIGEPAGQFGGFGVGTAYHGTPLTEREVARLKALRLTHYHVEVDPQKADWLALLRSALREAAAIGTKAGVSLPLSDDPEIEAVPAFHIAEEFPDLVQRWLVFTRGAPASREATLMAGRRCLLDGLSSIGGGTDADFFQLNNNRPPQGAMLFVSVPLRPCAHQFDRATLVENLTGQREVLKSMAALWPGLTRTVTPVTFRTRAQKGPATAPGELPPQADVRQMSLFAAAWTIGCIKAMAESGVSCPTLFQTTGLRGIMELESGSAAPREFHSIPGAVYPVYIALAAISSFLQGGTAEVIAAESDAPLTAEALVLKRDLRRRVLLANYTAKLRSVELKRNGVAAFASARAVVLDATNAVMAMTNPEEWLAAPPQRDMNDGTVVLPPFGVAWVDLP